MGQAESVETSIGLATVVGKPDSVPVHYQIDLYVEVQDWEHLLIQLPHPKFNLLRASISTLDIRSPLN